MMNRINNILIGLLWLLASTLGATFWFNTMFGFDILSTSHWQHLAYMQATGQAVKPSFYISVVVIILIVTFGLYKLLQPRFRHITLPIYDNSKNKSHYTLSQSITPNDADNISEPTAQPVINDITNDSEPQNVPPSQIARPPRLNIPNIPRTAPTSRAPLTASNQQKVNLDNEYTEIRNVFESAGYVYKGMPKIKNIQHTIIAIGTGEILWIGAICVKNHDMQNAINTISSVFSDTLDDIEIHINAFIINAPDMTDAPDNILQFATIDDLRNYIVNVPNTPPDTDDADNFDAYSGYIGTVVDYIGKI